MMKETFNKVCPMINDKTVKVVVFEIVCAIYRIVLSVHKLNKLGKFWLIYGQLLNIMSSYGWYEKSLR